MRATFESWCISRGYDIAPAETNCNIIVEGTYKHPYVQIAWEAWQESYTIAVGMGSPAQAGLSSLAYPWSIK